MNENQLFTASMRIGDTVLPAVLAEIFSVLKDSAILDKSSAATISLEELAAVCGDRVPPEERAASAADLCRRICESDAILTWLPYFSGLVDLEYNGDFYPAYRDHTIHTVQVLLLGLYLLERCTTIRTAVLEQLRATSDLINEDDETLLARWWTAAALWHDTGYVFEAEYFLSQPETALRLRAHLHDQLSRTAFKSILSRIDPQTSEATIDRLIGAGGFAPDALDAESLLSDSALLSPLDNLWRDLGLEIPRVDSPTSYIARLCVGGRFGRPPFHDHGIMSALMLQWSFREAETFIDGLSGARIVKKLPQAAKVEGALTQAYVNLQEWRTVVDSAAQAVLFHNIYWKHLPAEVQRMFPRGAPHKPGWNLRPDVAFLSLVDTLQDWGRAHFSAWKQPSTYRRNTLSDGMLISAAAGRVRVALRSGKGAVRPDSAAVVQKLFDGWLAPDVAAIIDDAPQYTYPAALDVGYSVSGSVVIKSESQRERLIGLIDEVVGRCAQQLLTGPADILRTVSRDINNLMDEIERMGKNILTPEDQQRVQEHLSNSKFAEVRATTNVRVNPGCILDKGVVERKLGQGGFGKVFLLCEHGSDRSSMLAFKLYHQAEIDDQEKVRLFVNGYKAMGRLAGHERVVNVRGFSSAPFGFYMDYVPGEDLGEKHVLKMYDSLHEKLDLIAEIASVVRDAHALQPPVYHRDIKPQNIIIDASSSAPRAVLTDFDLAWIGGGRTQTTEQLLATLHYGAPEQFDKRHASWRKTPRVDVYGLGALSYYVLVGSHPPFYVAWSDEEWQVLERRYQGHCSGLTMRRIIDFIRQATKSDPEERTLTVGAFLDGVARAKAALDQRALTFEEWKDEVSYKFMDRIHSGPLVTSSGTVRFELTPLDASGTILLSFQILGQPMDQGGTHLSYRDRVARKVSDACKRFTVTGAPSARAQKQGFMDTKLQGELHLIQLPLNFESALSCVELMRHIAAAVV